MSLVELWKKQFFATIQATELADALKEASIQGQMKKWTTALTSVVVAACEQRNWFAAAKGHKPEFLPEARFEYLGIDVMAFEHSGKNWSFPIATIELENSQSDDRIAYSLWKVLNLRAPLRIVFCYRPAPEAGLLLIKTLEESVVQSIDLDERMKIEGETLVVVGYRNNAETFPYGFFKWWLLNKNIGQFEQH